MVIIAIVALIAVPRIKDRLETDKVDGETENRNVVTIGGQKIMEGELTNEVELIGSTKAKESVSVYSKMPAEVEAINVVAGQFVEEGDVLFSLDKESVEDQITQAEIGLTLAQVGVKNAKAGITQAKSGYAQAQSNYTMQTDNYEFAVNNLSKYTQLYAEGVVSQMEYEQMKLQASPETANLLAKQLEQASSAISTASLGLESANANLQQAQEGYDLATDLLEDMTVTAPITGFVSMNYITEGNMASNAQPAMLIDDISSIIVEASVTESLINKVALGGKVKVVIGSLDNKEFIGTIDELSTTSDARTLLYPVKIKVENDNNQIKPGMFATVLLETERSDKALYVPSEAVILREGVRYVYVLRGEDKVERVQVEIGVDTGYFTELTKGVVAQDIIVTNGIGLIDEKSTVKLIRSDQ